MATAALNPAAAPSSSTQNANQSSNTYTGATVALDIFDCDVSSVQVTLTDNVGQSDTIQVNNCSVGLGGTPLATITASVTIPDGVMTSAFPTNIPQTTVSGQVTALLVGSSSPAIFELVPTSGGAQPTLQAVGGAAPTIVPNLSSWAPSAQQGSTAAMTQQITFTTNPSASYDAVSFTATPASTGNWLSVTPGELNTTSSLTVKADPTGLTAGTYNGTVTLSGLATPISVTLTINPPPATLSVVTPLAPFNWAIGTAAPSSQTLTINASPGSATITNVSSDMAWLQVSGPVGATPESYTVSVNTTGLTTAQQLNGNIIVTASNAANSPFHVPVTFNVAASSLNVSPSSGLTFNYTIGGNQPLAQPLTVSGTDGISYSVSSAVISPVSGTWLSATPVGSTTVPGSVSVSVITTGLTAGTYSGTVTVTSTGAAGSPATIPITLVVSAPTLTPNPTSLTFNYQLGANTPAAQPFAVTSVPSGISFSAAAAVISPSGGNWLQATVTNGTTPGSVSVSIINTAGLPAATGSYTGTVTISSNGATSQVVNVTLNVKQPSITAVPNSINFAYQTGTAAPAAQPIAVGGTSGLAISAAVSTNPPGGTWLSASVVNGTTPGSVSVSVNTSGLTAATYNGTVTLSAPGAVNVNVPVSLVVSDKPTISLTPSQVSFAYQIGGAAPQTQSVSVGGTSSLPFTATVTSTTGGAWLDVTNGSGNTPGSFKVGVNTSVLKTAGTYSGVITVAATGADSQTVNVSIVVSNLPAITASPSGLNFAYQINGTAPSARVISVNASSALSYSVAATGGAWLSVAGGSGTTPGTITVSINTSGLSTTQTLNGAITITASGASNSPLTVPVTLTVTPAPNKITLNPTGLNFTATANGTPPTPQTVNVTSTKDGSPVTIATYGGAWLIAIMQTGVTPAVVNVYANPANLPAGTYLGFVVVASTDSANSPQNIGVKFVVSPPNNLSATPANLSFNYTVGGTVPANQTVSVNSTQPVAISTSAAGASWLTAAASGSSTPASITVSVNPASLPVGTYQAAISISGTGIANSPEVIPVTLVVSNKPMLAPSPSSLTFSTQAGAANPASQSINITAGSAVPFSIATSPNWLSVSASASTTPSTLVVNVNSKPMAQGSYQGTITLTSSGADNSPITIPVTLNISTPQLITGPSVSSIVNGASYDVTGFSPGAIVTIFGHGLGPDDPAKGNIFSVRPNGSIDSTLAGASVTVEGIPAIPLFVSSGQINVILPFNLGTSGQANVEVQYNNQSSTDFNIALVPADVQIFTVDGSGSGPGSILNQDYSVNTKSHPADKGSVVQVYVTGAGLVSPSATAGDVAGDNLSTVSLPYTATVNGESADVIYAGTAPGLVYGVYQFNIQLPADVPAGAQKIVLSVGTSSSQPDVTVWVK